MPYVIDRMVEPTRLVRRERKACLLVTRNMVNGDVLTCCKKSVGFCKSWLRKRLTYIIPHGRLILGLEGLKCFVNIRQLCKRLPFECVGHRKEISNLRVLLGPWRKILSLSMAIYPIHDKDTQRAKNEGELSERHLWESVELRALSQDDNYT